MYAFDTMSHIFLMQFYCMHMVHFSQNYMTQNVSSPKWWSIKKNANRIFYKEF